MTAVGLSPALGIFIAGVVLADSEYRHELESDIEPFKGLLLGLFFISIGASLNFTLIGHQSRTIGGMVAGLVAIKAVALLVTAKIFKLPVTERLLFLPHDRLIAPRFQKAAAERAPDVIETRERAVILAGFGRLGTDLGRMLMSAGIKPVILDHNEANVDVLRRFGFEAHYGDVTRLDLLESAGAAEAELLIIALGDHEKSMKLVRLAQKHYPQLKMAVNAVDRRAAFAFMDLGVTTIRRETFGTALTLGQDALQLLGFDPYEAYKIRRLFRKKDKETLPELYRTHRQDEDNYIATYRQHNANQVELMTRDREIDMTELHKAWTAANSET